MATETVTPSIAEQEPELHLLITDQGFEEPLYKSLVRGLDEFFFPKKLPPLKLESKPIPVKDIWGYYSNFRVGGFGLGGLLVIGAAVVVFAVVVARHVVASTAPVQATSVVLIDPGNMPELKPAKTQSGGGGGDRDVLQASRGKLPKFSMQQITPPAAVIRNDNPKLPVAPTIVIPPEVKLLTQNNMPNLGDPLSHAVMPSNGTGSGSGIGEGEGGGVGKGKGPGFGPGEGGGTGGGLFHVGAGVSPPRQVYSPEPEFSEEARKAKYQGICTLSLIVGVDGRPTDIQVVGALGMGLDEKAIEAVRNWRFEPAMKDGHPVRVPIQIQVDFHLY